jgi:LCP family protein required for cell wall assembly
VVALVGGAAFGAFLLEPAVQALRQLSPGSSLQQFVSPAPRELLILGTDESGALTDVIASLYLTPNGAHLTQVPRDTFIHSPVFGELKVNSLYSLGGVDAVEAEVANLLGRPIQHHLLIKLSALRRLGDAVGGLQIDVPKPLYYQDKSQGLSIDLAAGPQLLKGHELEGFLRFRHDADGDLGRMDRQKMAMAALMNRLSQPQTLSQLPQLLSLAGKDIRTDLNPLQLMGIASSVAGKTLESSRLPGHVGYRHGISYWFVGSEPQN